MSLEPQQGSDNDDNDNKDNPSSYILDPLYIEAPPEPEAGPEAAENFVVTATPEPLSQMVATQLLTNLSDSQTRHVVQHCDITHPTAYALEDLRPSRYGIGSPFISILINTGAARFSTAGRA